MLVELIGVAPDGLSLDGHWFFSLCWVNNTINDNLYEHHWVGHIVPSFSGFLGLGCALVNILMTGNFVAVNDHILVPS